MNRSISKKIIHITDPHLHTDLQGTLLGLATQYSLDLVLDRIREEHSSFDAILATGDISQDSSLGAYQRFRGILEQFPVPSRWCPGNHDNPALMEEAEAGSELGNIALELGDWVILMLDTSVFGKVYGELSADELARLQEQLKNYQDRHVMVAFHHHPISMECKWIDTIGVRNAEEFHQTISQFSNVRVVLWGHVHQELDKVINGVRFISTPSTCVQFTPKTPDFKVDDQGPGYRWLELNADGSINTGVSRIEDVDFEIDYSVKGY